MKNIGPIYKKELKQNLREKNANNMMILIPISLILILCTALSSMFSTTSIELDGVKVLYTKPGDFQLEQAFNSFMEQGSKMGIEFEEINDVNAGVERVKRAEYSCYVLFEDDPRVIRLYKNDRYRFEASLVEAMLYAFAERYSAIAEVVR